ncbi:hypothetical protein BGZ99_003896 [Dissophora globulifera]|uniref:Uncharacterized protein n=1 Tax=Dissophora globulifera TaxID=979702 RepID=A0A9P6RJE8_9FUNG|nr:hypothetical protein BGZ99_003896 [Dissophora globulifera]
MSGQLNEKDDLNDDNLATHTELADNEGNDRQRGVVGYLMSLAPSSIPAVVPALTATDELTTLSSRTSEVHHRRYRFLAHAQDAYEQTPQEQDRDDQEASKSTRNSLLNERSRTLSTRILSSRLPSNRSQSPSPLPPLPLSPVNGKRKCGGNRDGSTPLSEMTPSSRGRDERHRVHPESTAAAVEVPGFKKSKSHHSNTGHMAVEMSAQFKNIRDCKIHIRK